jgi:type VI secretion system VasD/TssJ family lipoprotein
MNKSWLKAARWAGVIAVVSACAHPPPPLPPCPTPEPVRVALAASTRLNPGERGESLATTVRIYQLKDAAKLLETTLDRILDDDRAVLGEDFVSVQELTLYPGERAAPVLNRGEGANILAVVAMLRRPVGPSWRVVRKLSPPNLEYCHDKAAASAALGFALEDSRVEMR